MARSPWVYTIKAENRSPETLRDFFCIDPGQKVLLVAMASADERFASTLADAAPAPPKAPNFESQIAWIQELIEWTKNRKDVFLIVRVHPRDFPNKREQVLSRQALYLRSIFVDMPENVRVNWPDDAISLHDLANIVDVCLNATSTAGLEMLLLGIPVIIYDPKILFSYPPELNLYPSSREDYFSKIDEALVAEKSLNNIVGAFRWIAFKSDIMAIDISEAYGEGNIGQEEPAAKKFKSLANSLMARAKALVDKLIKRANAVPPQSKAFRDPCFSRSGLRHLRQADWLAYAIEHQVESHMDAYCDVFLANVTTSVEAEFYAVAEATRSYLGKLGARCDFLETSSIALPRKSHA